MEDGPLPDLRDIELKLGRKVPESLVRSLRGEEVAPLEKDRDPSVGSSSGGGGGGVCSSSSSCCSFPPSVSSSSSSSPTSSSPRPSHSSALERLETKLHLLRQEMVWQDSRACGLSALCDSRFLLSCGSGCGPPRVCTYSTLLGPAVPPFTLSVQKVVQSLALTAKILPALPRGGATGHCSLFPRFTPLPPLQSPTPCADAQLFQARG